jgi:hypothetical protein
MPPCAGPLECVVGPGDRRRVDEIGRPSSVVGGVGVSRPWILILAAEEDLHADAVVLALRDRNLPVVRIDPESDWTENTAIVVRHDLDDGAWSLSHHGRAFSGRDPVSVFCRSWNFRRADEQESLEEHLRLHEMGAGLAGFCRGLESRFWINRPWLEDRVESKVVQSRFARRAGLRVPETLVTNDPEQAAHFHAQCDGEVVVKQLSEVSLIDAREIGREDGVVYGFFTEPVSAEALDRGRESIRSAPVLFQRRIEKAADLRVTVVGDRVFAHRIESQVGTVARTDFRKDLRLRTDRIEPPPAIAEALRKLIASWGLHFAACDLVETPSGEHVFLEANVSGNWLWLEGPEEFPILDAVVADLAAGVA